MTEPFASDEAALWAAIREAPADAAPWLVYADWLQERGRDREAATVRRFLPQIQAEVLAGGDVPAVMRQVGRQDPDGPGWGLIRLPPLLSPAPEPPPPTVGPTAADPGTGSGLLLVFIGKAIALAVLGLVQSAAHRREPPPQPPKLHLGGDSGWLPRVQTVGAGTGRAPTTRPAGLILSPVPWDPAELTGCALRRVGDGATLEFRFTGPEAVETTTGGPAATIGPVTGRWWVDDLGTLNVTGPDGIRAFVLSRVRAAGDRSEVVRGGRQETYVREKLATGVGRPQ